MTKYSNSTNAAFAATWQSQFDPEKILTVIQDFQMRAKLEQDVDRWCFNVTAKPCTVCGHKMRLGGSPMGEAVYVCVHVMAALRDQFHESPRRASPGIGWPDTLNGLAIVEEDAQRPPTSTPPK